MDVKRKSASGSAKWQIEAKRRMAKWRQQLSVVRALAHGEIIVEVDARKGVKISTYVNIFKMNQVGFIRHKQASMHEQRRSVL